MVFNGGICCPLGTAVDHRPDSATSRVFRRGYISKGKRGRLFRGKFKFSTWPTALISFTNSNVSIIRVCVCANNKGNYSTQETLDWEKGDRVMQKIGFFVKIKIQVWTKKSCPLRVSRKAFLLRSVWLDPFVKYFLWFFLKKIHKQPQSMATTTILVGGWGRRWPGTANQHIGQGCRHRPLWQTSDRRRGTLVHRVRVEGHAASSLN